MSETSDTDGADGTTKSRRVRMLQAYSHAIEQMEESPATTSDDSDDVIEATSPDSSPRRSRPKLQRSRTMSDAMESLVRVDEDMAPYKLLNFLFHASVAGTFPYFTLYSKQLGLDAAQVGMVCGLRPALGSIVTPVVGWFADKYHLRRTSAVLCSLLWVFFTLIIAVVPPPETAECHTAIGDLEDMLPDDEIRLYLECKDHHKFTKPLEPLTRHLFLEKVVLPNVTATLIDDCTEETNQSSKVNALPSGSNVTKSGVGDMEKREVLEDRGVRDTGDVNDGAGDSEMRQMAKDGSWLFKTSSLRDAFISAFILAAFANMMQAPSLCLVDVATLDVLGRGHQREGYAWQRAFGVVGYVIFAIITLCVLEFSTTTITICGIEVQFHDYKVAFVIFAGVMTCAVAIICTINFKYEESHSYHFRDVLDVLLTIRHGSVLSAAFLLAICNGCIQAFLPWHLDNLGATNIFYILALVGFAVSEVAVSFYLPIFTRSKGHACLVLIGIWIYCFMFIGYALMEKPHWAIIIELFHGAAFALTWNPITTYLTGAVCREYLTTMQGIITGTYSGLGNVVGSIGAGLLVRSNGAVVTFYGFAVMCMVFGILFLVINRETGLLQNCKGQQSKYDTIGKD